MPNYGGDPPVTIKYKVVACTGRPKKALGTTCTTRWSIYLPLGHDLKNL